jgi:hypothetical protein
MTQNMNHIIIKRPFIWILTLIFMISFSNLKAQRKNDGDFKQYEGYLYKIAEYQLDYPNLLFDYNYNHNGEVASVTISGVEDKKAQDDLEKLLLEMHDVSDLLLYAKDENGIYYRTEERARFKKGGEALHSAIKDNLIYPETAVDRNIEGVVQLKFVVDRTGNVKNLDAMENIDGAGWIVKEMVNEAKNAFNAIDQDWIPGEIDNVEVPQWIILPVYFKVEPYPDMLPRM